MDESNQTARIQGFATTTTLAPPGLHRAKGATITARVRTGAKRVNLQWIDNPGALTRLAQCGTLSRGR